MKDSTTVHEIEVQSGEVEPLLNRLIEQGEDMTAVIGDSPRFCTLVLRNPNRIVLRLIPFDQGIGRVIMDGFEILVPA